MIQKKQHVGMVVLGLIALLAIMGANAVLAGGWALVIVDNVPVEAVAGREFTVHFSVRQHGQTPVPNLSPRITAEQVGTNERLILEARETAEEGVYLARMTLPAAGEWNWSIYLWNSTYYQPPIKVLAAAGQAATEPISSSVPLPIILGPVALLAAGVMVMARMRQGRRIWLAGAAVALLIALAAFGWQRQQTPVTVAEGVEAAAARPSGEALFVAKGCAQCHQNGRVTITTQHFNIGPDLTNLKSSPEFLRLWLADPPAVRPGTIMPDLDLSAAEIETLIAFLLPDG